MALIKNVLGQKGIHDGGDRPAAGTDVSEHEVSVRGVGLDSVDLLHRRVKPVGLRADELGPIREFLRFVQRLQTPPDPHETDAERDPHAGDDVHQFGIADEVSDAQRREAESLGHGPGDHQVRVRGDQRRERLGVAALEIGLVDDHRDAGVE